MSLIFFKVRIRLLTIDSDLKPQKTVLKQVFIIDPSGSRVNQWLDVDSKMGLVNLEMPMSKEPNMGKWTILGKASDDSKELKAYFEVRKYVLPKFELTIGHKNKIIASEKSINVTLCSKLGHLIIEYINGILRYLLPLRDLNKYTFI
jgi:uncharacterized protein YfaS (alpha-2-macroglobulin family)